MLRAFAAMLLLAAAAYGWLAMLEPAAAERMPWLLPVYDLVRPHARADAALRDSVSVVLDSALVARERRLAHMRPWPAAERERMRRSSYRRHVVASQALGALAPGGPGLVPVPPRHPHYLAPWGRGLLAPEAVVALDSLGAAFARELAQAGLPPVRFVVTSTYRDSAHQARLRTTNPYAAKGTSSHEFGGSFDISLTRFAPAEAVGGLVDSLTRLAREPVRARLRRALVGRERDWAGAVIERSTAPLDAALGRALLDLERRGLVWALREEGPGCYHVTARPAGRG